VIAKVVMFILVAVVGGFASSWYMIERGSPLTTVKRGPWTAWVSAGRSDADPYTRAHYARRGSLPVSSLFAQTYQATTDSDGQTLYSTCEYVIEGPEPDAAFWSLAVFDEKGALIANPADRYGYNSATLMRSPGGHFGFTLSRSARPGNWIPTGGAGRLAVQLTIEEPKPQDKRVVDMPQIRRLGCR
jgi:hypothetical protein